jgi:hypothetical protein
MTETLKVLGQSVPTATTLTTLYTVPAATSAVISSIVVCNQNSSTTIRFRVSIAIGGAADATSQYLYYDLPLLNNDTFIATVGISLAATDVVRIQSDTANVSFNLLGVEVA